MPRLDPLMLNCLADNVWIGVVLMALIPISVIALIFWFSSWRVKKRTEEFQRVAGEIGLPFYPLGDNSLLGSLGHFYLFLQGRGGTIRNMLHGQSNDVEMAIFDYHYTVGSGKNSRTYYQNVIYFRSPHLSLPHFAMRPEGFFHRIGTAFGYQDIDFESHPQFSRKYLLRGSNDSAIRSFFQADLLTFLESQQQISVDGGGDQMVFYRHGKYIKSDEVRDFMQQGFQVYAQFRGAPPEQGDAALETESEANQESEIEPP